MSDVPPKNRRIQQGDFLFKKFIIPVISSYFPGSFYSTNGLPVDYTAGVDFIHVDGGQVSTLGARVWQSYPFQHFTLRHSRTGDPRLVLEYHRKLEAYRNGGPLPDWTVEGYIHKGLVYVAMTRTRVMMDVVSRYGSSLPTFTIQNPSDQVNFTRVPFHKFPQDSILKWRPGHEDILRPF